MKVREECSCGASIEAESITSVDVERVISNFRADHHACARRRELTGAITLSGHCACCGQRVDEPEINPAPGEDEAFDV